jgi:hypothetical protein
MNFNNVNILGISYQKIDFDSNYVFQKKKAITLSGNFLDLGNDSGVKNIIEAYSDLIEIENALNLTDSSITHNLQEIFINSVSYGEGTVESIAISGEHIQTAEFQASLIFVEEGDLSKILISKNSSSSESFNSSGLTNEDLKYLDSFDENFSFGISGSQRSVGHEISCSFKKRKSLIPYRKNVWSNSSIQNSKLKNLNNKGKGSIKVLNGETASHQIFLESGDYILELEYLGQDSDVWGQASVQCESKTENLPDIYSHREIQFNVDVDKNVNINLIANTTSDTFFDNIKLFKKSEMPLEKARQFVNFIFSESPEYPIISDQFGENYSDVSLYERLNSEESFDSINNSYSVAKSLQYNETDSTKQYSRRLSSSINFEGNGVATIKESIEIKILKEKTDTKLKNFLQLELSGSRARGQALLDEYGQLNVVTCPTPTITELIEGLFGFSESLSVQYDFDSGLASAEISYSNNQENEIYSGSAFKVTQSRMIEFNGGFEIVRLSGNIVGKGDDIITRNNHAKKGLQFIVEGTNSTLREIEGRYKLDYYSTPTKTSTEIQTKLLETNKTLSFDDVSGVISYSYSFSNERGVVDLPEDQKDRVKKYEIKISHQNRINLFNEFSINCLRIAQVMGDLFSPKVTTVEILVNGRAGTTLQMLKQSAVSILGHKNLLFGEISKGVKDDVINSNENKFLVDESYSYDPTENRLSYSRSILDVSDCPTSNIGDGYPWTYEADFEEPTEPTRTSFEYQPIEYNFKETPSESGFVLDPDDYEIEYPEPTLTDFYSEEVPPPTFLTSPAVTRTSFPETTQTPTISESPEANDSEDRLVEVFVPEDWNKTISELVPGGTIISGRRCFDESGGPNNLIQNIISTSYAFSTVVRDCIRGGSGQPWYSFTFSIPRDQGFTPPYSDNCQFFNVTVPDFYDENLNCLLKENGVCIGDSSNLIGYHIAPGTFIYSDLYTSETFIIAAQTYNNNHPYFNKGEVVNGEVSFQICKDDKSGIVKTEQVIQTVSIPFNSGKTVVQEIIDGVQGWQAGKCYEMIGLKDCSSGVRFNLNDRRYYKGDVLDRCGELSFNDLVTDVYVREFSCSSTVLDESVIYDYESPVTPTSTVTETATVTPTVTITTTATPTVTITTTITETETIDCSGCFAYYDSDWEDYSNTNCFDGVPTCSDPCACSVVLNDNGNPDGFFGGGTGPTLSCCDDEVRGDNDCNTC